MWTQYFETIKKSLFTHRRDVRSVKQHIVNGLKVEALFHLGKGRDGEVHGNAEHEQPIHVVHAARNAHFNYYSVLIPTTTISEILLLRPCIIEVKKTAHES
jgi:hypothetical protein